MWGGAPEPGQGNREKARGLKRRSLRCAPARAPPGPSAQRAQDSILRG